MKKNMTCGIRKKPIAAPESEIVNVEKVDPPAPGLKFGRKKNTFPPKSWIEKNTIKHGSLHRAFMEKFEKEEATR